MFSGAVHCPQNLKPGGFSKWHLGQTSASGAVHWPQNLIPPGFSKPHFEQRIGGPPNPRRLMGEYRWNTVQRKQPREEPRVTKGPEFCGRCASYEPARPASSFMHGE
jgi:hypothetical protein